MKRDWKPKAGIFLGLAIAGVTLFANQLGLDNNPAWGAKRFILFSFGILILGISLLYREDNFLGRTLNTRNGQLYFLCGLLVSLIILAYVWCVSVGLWTTWPESTNYYDMLATSFSHGRLALEVKPDPALLALKDPYENISREGIPVIWDASLYQGKYYFYWGPTPALLLALIKRFYTNQIGDNILTLVFFVGMLIFLSLLILGLWKGYFPETPRWAVLLSIPFVGLINPIPFALLDSQVYEAAIASGQFFFIGGLYWLFTTFNQPSIPRLTLASIFFALAVGSRNTLILPVGFLALIVLIWVIKAQRARAFTLILAFALPLFLGAVSYGWYNFARFGSVTEFGFRYQLNSFNIFDSVNQVFSITYVPPNLFKTLLNPFERRDSFPFIRATRGFGPAWFESFLPEFYLYYAEGTTGILVGSPFVIFALLAGLRKKENLNWILISLTGSTLLILLTLQVFFYTAMRYLLDLIPALSLLAVIGFWNGLYRLQTRPAVRWAFATLGTALCLYGFAISFLLTISSHLPRFRTYNLDLLQQLTSTFNNLFK